MKETPRKKEERMPHPFFFSWASLPSSREFVVVANWYLAKIYSKAQFNISS
jgi:hypothetical protein